MSECVSRILHSINHILSIVGMYYVWYVDRVEQGSRTAKSLGCRVRYCRKVDVMSELTTTELTLNCMQGIGLFPTV